MCVSVWEIGMCLHVNPMIPDIHFLHMLYLIVTALGFVCMCFLYFSHCVCLFICVCLCKKCVCVRMLNPTILDTHFLHMVCLIVLHSVWCVCVFNIFLTVCASLYVCLCIYVFLGVCLCICESMWEIGMCPHVKSHDSGHTFSSYGIPYSDCTWFGVYVFSIFFSLCVSLYMCVFV
jgi:hypothetical protein